MSLALAYDLLTESETSFVLSTMRALVFDPFIGANKSASVAPSKVPATNPVAILVVVFMCYLFMVKLASILSRHSTIILF